MKHVILNKNRLHKRIFRLLKDIWPFIFMFIALGLVGNMEYEDQICKNPKSEQCINYKNNN